MAQGRTLLRLGMAAILMLVMFALGWVVAKSGGAAVDPASLTELERQFTERMQNVALIGQFTVAGREDRTGVPERYEIKSVEKVNGDRWRFNARMQYGKLDVTLPITIPVLWVGDTPMIAMTDFNIPTLGTFSVRLLFYGDRYAGTWQHDKVGGHMFGRIGKMEGS